MEILGQAFIHLVLHAILIFFLAFILYELLSNHLFWDFYFTFNTGDLDWAS